jgi:hypothetical protein
MLQVFIGYDKHEIEAFHVCVKSILKHATKTLSITPLCIDSLRGSGLYWRATDGLASTEFTYTRFLVPYLMGYSGNALFIDCDFLFVDNICKLFDVYDPKYAVMCVKHSDYTPESDVKMGNKIQSTYPRKNWSSLMMFNCSHEYTKTLTPPIVNSNTGAYLHRMQWVPDELIGNIDCGWNWIGDLYRSSEIKPKAIHFTNGGPWHGNNEVDYAKMWLDEYDSL